MTALLELRSVSRSFGGLNALTNVNPKLLRGEIVGLIGPNGAGKTTLVNVATGVHPPTSGEVVFAGERVDGMPVHAIARLGLARTFQVMQPFPKMTVLDNVAAGALFAGGAKSPTEAREAALEHLAFTGLAGLAGTPASSLTLAHRKRLELAKSLAMRPSLLMLDEVNAGLNQAEIDSAMDLIRAIADRGITVIIIEHLMKVVSRICTRLVVLHHGELIADGATHDVLRDPTVIDAYLGKRFAQRVEMEMQA